MSPALASIFREFADASQTTLYLITTLPSITLMISALLTGLVVGKKIKYKTVVIIGSLLFIIGGVAPTFFHSSLEVILIFRAVFGFGCGMLVQLGNALVTGLFQGHKRTAYIGYGQLVADGIGVVVLLLCGFLAAIDWKYSFLIFFVGLVPLVFAFFLPEPEPVSHHAIEHKPASPEQKRENRSSIWLLSLFFLIGSMIIIPIQFNISIYFADKEVGGPALSGIAVSVYTLAGAVGGMVFGQCMKRLKKPLSLFFLTGATGAVLLLLGQDTFTLMLGAALCGFMFSTSMAYGYTLVGMKVSHSSAPMVFNILQICFNLGVFLCTYFLGLVGHLFGSVLYPHLMIATGFFLLITILFLFVNPIPTRNQVTTHGSEDLAQTP
ncbi:MFS transporter [Paenibacillus lemnae]|uniref:MFS transporter n=1 Tax=Paenibacillus lemnae TaxID=1330551 RepID=A0A848M6G5_PAELE|nr:MFS transporter [Paenibacillus lemnae]NMO96577.1 MFS transporter [Paenibacillus lemnae]